MPTSSASSVPLGPEMALPSLPSGTRASVWSLLPQSKESDKGIASPKFGVFLLASHFGVYFAN